MDSTQRELVHGYLAKARDKARVARDLLARGEWEDAVSRAYYGAYHAAQAALLTEGHRGETHRGVVVLFGLLLVKTGKLDRRWGRLLVNLKDDREASDYDALSFVDEATARRAVEEATAFVAHMEGYVAGLLREEPTG